MDKKIIGAIILVFGIGFFSGSEYRAYQLRDALQKAFTQNTEVKNVVAPTQQVTNNEANKPKNTLEKAKDEKMIIVQKMIGEEISFATIKLKINTVEEKQIISSQYGTPKVAKEGAKFAILNFDVTNITEKAFGLSPDFLVVDNKGREFNVYNDSIGNIDNYLNYRNLNPSIKEVGNLVYEIPTDSVSYDLYIAKGGTNDLYKIKLK